MTTVMQWLSDPRAFNFLIMGLYGCNAVRWAFARSWGDSWYWVGAFIITAAITFGVRHGA